MNKLNKQGINILKIIFSNTGRRISLFVSLILMLVLSGILAEQVERIEQAYARDITLDISAIDQEWARVSGRRHG